MSSNHQSKIKCFLTACKKRRKKERSGVWCAIRKAGQAFYVTLWSIYLCCFFKLNMQYWDSFLLLKMRFHSSSTHPTLPLSIKQLSARFKAKLLCAKTFASTLLTVSLFIQSCLKISWRAISTQTDREPERIRAAWLWLQTVWGLVIQGAHLVLEGSWMTIIVNSLSGAIMIS